METSYDEICQNVGQLYLTLSSKVTQLQGQLSHCTALLRQKDDEIKQLKAQLANVPE